MVALLQASITLLLALTTVDSTTFRQETRDLSEMASSQSDTLATSLLTRVNEERRAHGLSPLCSNKKLQAAAQRHVKDQSKTDYISDIGTDDSTPKQRVTEAGYKWQTVGENIGAGYADADKVVDWWMKNQEHTNVLGEFTMTGVAYMYNEHTYSKHYWVQVFATGTSEECETENDELVKLSLQSELL
ncbi:SCP-like extracellular protein [Phytophthora megakarya]|uniref:SCP-like extracellular protein n=1 Tax=Phytophthora megakarya TaxID=4795 RepID=A0A225UTD2_9STRA|nr:SCP-like extracellular protein [Phytophthora megakarya]